MLVAVHGQSDQWRLRQPEQHRVVLDRFAGADVETASADYAGRYDEFHQVAAEVTRLRALARDRAREVDVLRAGLEEIEAVDPQPGEDGDLRAEDERLAHADGLRASAAQAHALLSGDDDESGAGGVGVSEQLASARAAITGMTGHDPSLLDLDRRLAELGYLAADLGGDLAAYLAGVEVDPARLAWVQERRAELARVQRKYGDTIDDVLAWAKESAARLDELEGADDRAEELSARLETLRDELADAAATLSAARRAAAVTFGERVTTELSHLAMGKAVVQVALGRRPDPDGAAAAGRGRAGPVHPARRRRRRDPAGRQPRRPGPQRRQGGLGR